MELEQQARMNQGMRRIKEKTCCSERWVGGGFPGSLLDLPPKAFERKVSKVVHTSGPSLERANSALALGFGGDQF